MPEHKDLALKPDAEFDLLLRSALNTYADPGSDLDLAQQILARVAAESAGRQTRRWLPWAIAVPVAAGLLILIMLSGSKPMHRVADGTSQARVLQSPSTNVSGGRPSSISLLASDQHTKASRPRQNSRDNVAAAGTTHLPKLDVFPTPRPLTPEEQAFADYVARSPETERQSLIEAQKRVEAPLAIAAIQIPQLEPPGQGAN